MKVTINSNKRIGSVIYVCEGEETEIKLLSCIFNKLLDYEVIEYNKKNNKFYCFKSYKDKYSKIYLIPAKSSNIKSILLDDNYFNDLYRLLAIEYGLDVENNAVYYLFDRDRQSNKTKYIKQAISRYSNSRDNKDGEMNGLLLLSYPSIEAFLLNAHGDREKLGNGQLAKLYCFSEGYKEEIILNQLVKTTEYLLISLKEDFNVDLVQKDIDDFSALNMKIFEIEEDRYKCEGLYVTLSLLAISFLDLEILN